MEALQILASGNFPVLMALLGLQAVHFVDNRWIKKTLERLERRVERIENKLWGETLCQD